MEPEVTVEESYTIFYVWDESKPLFDIYNIARSYVINEFYSLDSAILLALIKDMELPITESLNLIPYIHSGYLEIILANREKDNGRQNS